jgi:hypothetical protein
MPLRASKGAPRYKRCRELGMSNSPLARDRVRHRLDVPVAVAVTVALIARRGRFVRRAGRARSTGTQSRSTPRRRAPRRPRGCPRVRWSSYLVFEAIMRLKGPSTAGVIVGRSPSPPSDELPAAPRVDT